VLDEVGEAFLTGFFVPGTDMDPDVESDNRGRWKLLDKNTEPIFEIEGFVFLGFEKRGPA